jgi:MFS family permease
MEQLSLAPPSPAAPSQPLPLRLVRVPRSRYRNLRADLLASLGDGISANIMIGAGETYFSPFVLALGFGEVAAGLVTTLPMLAGALLQALAVLIARRVKSNRRWVTVFAGLQAFSLLPLVIGAWRGEMSLLGVYAAAALYWMAGYGTGPAWNTWMESLVPPRLRAHYFARRTRWCQSALLVSLILAGLTLQYGKQQELVMVAFAVVFFVAALGRGISAHCLSRQSKGESFQLPREENSLASVWAWLNNSSEKRLLLYLLAVQACVQISGPYFIPYMLGTLGFTYAQFVVLITAQYLTKIIVLPALGGLAHRLGARRLLWLSGMAVIPLSSLWVISTNFWYLIGVQMLSGMAWGGFELAVLLVFFEAIPAAHRTPLMTIYNLGHALATAVGSILGGAILVYGNKAPGAFWTIFLVSAASRLVVFVSLFALAPRSQRLAEAKHRVG